MKSIEEEKKGSSGAWYLLAGVAAGAILGVLYAPRSGAETREEIADWRRRNRASGRTFFSRVKEIFQNPESVSAAEHGYREELRERETVGAGS